MSLGGEQNGMALVVEFLAHAGVVLVLEAALAMYQRWARREEACRRLRHAFVRLRSGPRYRKAPRPTTSGTRTVNSRPASGWATCSGAGSPSADVVTTRMSRPGPAKVQPDVCLAGTRTASSGRPAELYRRT